MICLSFWFHAIKVAILDDDIFEVSTAWFPLNIIVSNNVVLLLLLSHGFAEFYQIKCSDTTGKCRWKLSLRGKVRDSEFFLIFFSLYDEKMYPDHKWTESAREKSSLFLKIPEASFTIVIFRMFYMRIYFI